MKQRILVVDDDPKHCELLKHWLESEGHEAILAQTLEEGFVGIATSPLSDVILLDIHLEKRRGLMLVQWARKQRHLEHLQIAAVTELKSFKELKSIEEAGCDACFIKPIDFKTLREHLAGLTVHSVT
jgi:DNA-binding response OmpR family regulator